MSLARFFTEERFAADAVEASLAAEDLHHAVRVLRLRVGEEVELVDRAGQVLHLLLTHCSPDEVKGEVLSRRLAETRRLQLHLLQGLPRGSKVEEIIQKGVELGLDRFYPLLTQQSQIRLDESAKRKKHERWTKIAEMAASQSGRDYIPEIMEAQSLETCLRTLREDDLAHERRVLNFICWENEKRMTLAHAIQQQRLRDHEQVRILVGPEGGFAEKEVEMAIEYGFTPVSLGSNILRTETAGPAVLAMIGFAMELL